MLLEGLATQHGAVAPLAGGCVHAPNGVLDLLPLAQALIDCDDAPRGAALFHATLIEGLTDWSIAAARKAGVSTVAFGGGCFLNALLPRGLGERLARAGFDVIAPRQAPANDGGIALGQACVARHALATQLR
jgi:hydrogenase maturation protein HypF